MEKRRFGRTEHLSTVAIFGAFATSTSTQAEADAIMEKVIAAGVNHIDISPLYGDAEQRVGPWMRAERSRFFLGGKTRLRGKQEAAEGLRRSLETLQTDHFDLFQHHEVVSMEELDACTRPGGALEAFVDARDEGLTRFIGICSHGLEAPAVLLEAFRRFDYDSVLFPLNRALMAKPDYRRDAEEVLRQCRAHDRGVMIIKTVAREPWHGPRSTYVTDDGRTKTINTWYRPWDDAQNIQDSVNFVLSHDVTGLCTSGEPSVLPLTLAACERFTRLDAAAREAALGAGVPVFDETGPLWG